jgi:anti-sigma factor RsiW
MSYRVEDALASGRCPADPEQTAESYILGNLPRQALAAFEDHYLTCSHCAGLVEEMAHYVVAMQTALRRQRSVGPLPS